LISILLDQGLPRSAASLLRDEGWDVLHTGDIGLSRSTDRQILEFARNEQRVIITLDSDFHTILALTNASTPSVIRIRLEGLRGPDLALLIKRIWPRVEPQVKKGAMVTVTESGIRIRNIPLFSS
jgi:predicted nuclease of predicted toxin-antitoxin system